MSIDIDQPHDKPFTSSDVQHLDTESSLKSPSISPFAGSRVDSAEVKILYKGDDKNPTVKKPHIHETSAMVSDQMRRIKREKLRIASNLNEISHPSEGQYRISLSKCVHPFYSRHQTSPQIVSGHSLGKSPMYSKIDSCQIQKEREHKQMSGHQLQSLYLQINDRISKDNDIMQKEQLSKGYCKESLEIHSAQLKKKRRLGECGTRDLITESCPARNCVHSQRRDYSLQTERKGELNSSAVLQRQQSSSIQTDRGWCNTRPETDSHLFKLDGEKAEKKNHKEAFGLGKIVTPNKYSYLK